MKRLAVTTKQSTEIPLPGTRWVSCRCSTPLCVHFGAGSGAGTYTARLRAGGSRVQKEAEGYKALEGMGSAVPSVRGTLGMEDS